MLCYGARSHEIEGVQAINGGFRGPGLSSGVRGSIEGDLVPFYWGDKHVSRCLI